MEDVFFQTPSLRVCLFASLCAFVYQECFAYILKRELKHNDSNNFIFIQRLLYIYSFSYSKLFKILTKTFSCEWSIVYRTTTTVNKLLVDQKQYCNNVFIKILNKLCMLLTAL